MQALILNKIWLILVVQYNLELNSLLLKKKLHEETQIC